MIDKHHWLKSRAEIYKQYQELPRHCEPFGLLVGPAEHGWIDMTFSTSDKHRKITLSSYPEPFVGIRQWLEDIIVCTDRLDFTLDIDCDGDWNTILHFEHLYDLDNDGGLFYLYESCEDGYLAAYINFHEFIRLIYTRILNYAIDGEKTEEFKENWFEYISDDDYPDGLLSSVFRSEIIETYLKLDNRYKTRWHFVNEQ